MKNTFLLNQSFASIFWADKLNSQERNSRRNIARNIFLMMVGSCLIALSAKIAIPLEPVPVTLQTLTVLFLGMTYGWRLGCGTVVLYIVEGVLGLPVFAEAQASFAVLLGPNGGYLLSWLPAVFVTGFLMERGWSKYFVMTLLASLIGNFIILGGGTLMLTNFVGWSQAVALGFMPFLVGDSLKSIFLAFVVPYFWKTK